MGPFLDPFFWGFGALWVPLGSLLGPLEARLGGLKSEKMQTVPRENSFENAAFWFFEAPDGSLGLFLPPLWPTWSQNGSQNGLQKWSRNLLKSGPKIGQKVVKK